MAVLAPVLERQVNTENVITTEESRNTLMTAEERHNSLIKLNYARLINPDTTVGDIIAKESAPAQHVEQPVMEQKPFLVENARADADIFRADSIINRRQTEVDEEQEEEENEDLRPSATTIQYKSDVASRVVIEDNISNKQEKVSRLTKRDKIIMAVALLVIVALFVLVIVNSAVLSNLNSELSFLQSDLAVAEENYSAVLESKESYFGHIEEIVADFAQQHGMFKI